MDRAISSFTATIRGLAYARTHQSDAAAETTLVVAVPDAGGVAPLPSAAAEAQAVAGLVHSAHLLPHPTRAGVLAALPDYAVAHFACHGEDDWTDPTASRLVLYDHEIEPLTVRDISALHLKSRLAYLSACNTMITSPALANEAVHLTGAFHLAGYQHVIGTLWPINDFISRRFATGFYSYITQAGATTPDITRSAHALHHGTRRLRARYPDSPTQWAAYTHTGP
jgi:CHAT domain-containing protein